MTQEEAVQVRRDGAVRREVRRRGARDLGRRLGPRALRRHARPPLRPARRGQAARRVLDRLRRTPGRGAGGRRRLPLPGPRARAGRAADRGAQGAPRAAARAGQRHRRAAARGREGDREGPGRPAARRRRPARRRGRGRRRRHVVAHRADGAGGGDVRTLALDVRGRLPAGRPARSSIIGTADGKVAVVVAVNDAARGARHLRQRAGRASARWSAARAAARTTWPRAAAPTPPGSTRRSRWSAPRSAAPVGAEPWP